MYPDDLAEEDYYRSLFGYKNEAPEINDLTIKRVGPDRIIVERKVEPSTRRDWLYNDDYYSRFDEDLESNNE